MTFPETASPQVKIVILAVEPQQHHLENFVSLVTFRTLFVDDTYSPGQGYRRTAWRPRPLGPW